MTQPRDPSRHPAQRRTLVPFFLSLALSAAALVWLATAGAGAAAEKEVQVPPAPEGFALDGDAEAGRELFVKHCAVCHGETGAGDGKLSEHLRPNPGDLGQRVGERSPWEIYLTVRDGGQAVGLAPTMVGFGERLPEEQILDVATYTRSLEHPE